MTDFPSAHELDDELLSAYLDDELSDNERAAVEARLSSDTAAQELLEQLRCVSQAVQNLPTESVGHDMSEAIRRRLKPTLPLPLGEGQGEGEAASPSTVTLLPRAERIESATKLLPPLTIGRTRRAWTWASLAAAAALLIMVLQSDREANQGGPLLAQNGETTEGVVADETRSAGRPRGDLEFRALDERLARPSGEMLAELDAANRRGGEISDLATRAAVPASPVAPPAADDLSAADSAAGAGMATAVPEAAPIDGVRGGAMASASPAAIVSAADRDAAQLVVVRVLAKRSALQNKAFDRVLASNQIVLADTLAPTTTSETQPAAAPLALSAPADRYSDAEPAAPAAEAEHVSESDIQSQITEEAVLVEASPTALFSCIESINQDSQNFSGLAVDDAAANVTAYGVAVVEESDESNIALTADAKQRANDLGLTRFNRGVVPKQQRQLSRDAAQFYYLAPTHSDRFWRESVEAKTAEGLGGYGGQAGYGGRGGYGASAPVEPIDKRTSTLSLGDRQWAENSSGWAIRLQAAGGETAQSAASQRPSRRVATLAESARREKALPAAAAVSGPPNSDVPQDTDRLQVLFLLSPEAGAASAPVESRAE